MHDVGQGMKHLAQAMTAEVAYHRAALLSLGIALDGMADIAGGGAGLYHGNAPHHGLIGDVHQARGLQLHVADGIHAAGVAVPAVQDHGDVNVHHIAVAQRLVFGDAVTHHMIDAGADGVAIAAIAQAGRGGAMGDDIVIGQLVNMGGGDAGLHLRHQHVQNLGGQPAGAAHAFEIGGLVDRDGKMRLAGRLENLVLGYDGH